jgi:hypothetical protein
VSLTGKKHRKKEKKKKSGYKKTTNFDITTILIIHSLPTSSEIVRNFTIFSSSKTLQVHILTRNRIFEATLAVSNKQEYEKQTTTDLSSFPSIHDSNQATCPPLSIPISLFSSEMADFLNCPMNLPAPSDSVHNSDGSPISVFNTDNQPSATSHYTTLEPSFELPVDDTLFQEILDNTEKSPTLDDDWLTDFPLDSIDQLLSTDPTMTFKDLTDMTMEQNDEYLQHVEVTTDISSTQHDETTTSSVGSASEDNERNDINRRGLKKSGGPVRKLARFGNKQVIKYSNEYHDRRIKNNEAVKKSRMKSKEKQKETAGKMAQLANENRSLNDRVDLLMKELQVLKSLYKELNQDLPISAVRALERVNLH